MGAYIGRLVPRYVSFLYFLILEHYSLEMATHRTLPRGKFSHHTAVAGCATEGRGYTPDNSRARELSFDRHETKTFPPVFSLEQSSHTISTAPVHDGPVMDQGACEIGSPVCGDEKREANRREAESKRKTAGRERTSTLGAKTKCRSSVGRPTYQASCIACHVLPALAVTANRLLIETLPGEYH